jgi:hypothetical protein
MAIGHEEPSADDDLSKRVSRRRALVVLCLDGPIAGRQVLVEANLGQPRGGIQVTLIRGHAVSVGPGLMNAVARAVKRGESPGWLEYERSTVQNGPIPEFVSIR